MVKQKKHISDKQVAMLKVIWKYRFITRDVLMDLLGSKTGSTIFARLEVLVSYGLLGKRYDKSFSLNHIPAYYYVTPNGLRKLNEQDDEQVFITDAMIRASYKDPTASLAFMQHSVSIAATVRILESQYNQLRGYTKRTVAKYSYFPDPFPDAFLSLRQGKDKEPLRYFIDYVPATTDIRDLRTKLKQYEEYRSEGDWYTTKVPHPVHLFLFQTEKQAKVFRRKLVQMVYSLDAEELQIYTATLYDLHEGYQAWATLGDEEELWGLEDIPLGSE